MPQLISSSLQKQTSKMRRINNYVTLIFDEMKIREDLVFDKHSCSLLGFTDLGDVSNTLDNYEQQCKGESNDTADKSCYTYAGIHG